MQIKHLQGKHNPQGHRADTYHWQEIYPGVFEVSQAWLEEQIDLHYVAKYAVNHCLLKLMLSLKDPDYLSASATSVVRLH